MYEKGLFANGINLISSTNWKIKEADFRENPRGVWIDAAQNSESCNAILDIDQNNTLTIIATSQDANGIITREFVKETDKLVKINVTFKQLDPTKLTKKYGLEEITVYSDDIDFLTVADTDIDKQRLSLTAFERNELNTLQISKDGLVYDFSQGFDKLSNIDIERVGSQIKQTVRYYESDILLLGNEFVVDPTFGYSDSSWARRINTNAITGTSCGSSTYVTTTSVVDRVFSPETADSNNCMRSSQEWDITSISDSATITDTKLKINPSTIQGSVTCTYSSIETQPSTLSASALWTDVADGTAFLSNDSSCGTASSANLDLGSSADSDLEANLGADWWAIGVKVHAEEPRNTDLRSNYAHNNPTSHYAQLEVTYTVGATEQDETDETGLEDSISKSITKNLTDELGVEDTVQTMTANTVNISDELGVEDSIQKSINKDYVDETGLEDDTQTQTAAVVNITDELGLEDAVQTTSSILNLSDSMGLEDSLDTDVAQQLYNAIRLYLNVPATDRLGGVFAFTCPSGEYVRGIDTGGNLICAPLPP